MIPEEFQGSLVITSIEIGDLGLGLGSGGRSSISMFLITSDSQKLKLATRYLKYHRHTWGSMRISGSVTSRSGNPSVILLSLGKNPIMLHMLGNKPIY